MSAARQYGKAGKVARLVSNRRASGEYGAERASTAILDENCSVEPGITVDLKRGGEQSKNADGVETGMNHGARETHRKTKAKRRETTTPITTPITHGAVKTAKDAKVIPTKSLSSPASASNKNKLSATAVISNSTEGKPALQTKAKPSPAAPKAVRISATAKRYISPTVTPPKRKYRLASSDDENEEQPKKRLRRQNTVTASSPASTSRAISQPVMTPVTVPRRSASIESMISTVSNTESLDTPTKPPLRPGTPPPRVKPKASITTPGPRDLSFLFPSTPERSPKRVPVGSPSKGGLAKRMLARSRTEGSFTSISMSSQTASPSSAPSTPSRTASLPTPVELFPKSKPPPVGSPAAVRPAQRTYSQSRSFLVEMRAAGTSAQLPRDAIMQLDQELLQESYSDLRARYGVDDSDDVTMNMPTNDLKSMTEMRSKGENRRLWDEITYLFDGLSQSSSAGMKRSSAVEIVRKMGDADFVRKSKSADFFGRSWRSMIEAGAGSGSDKTLDACLAITCYVISRDPREAEELSSSPHFLDVMEHFLSTPSKADPLVLDPDEDESVWARRIGICKVQRTLLKEVRLLASRHLDLGAYALSSRSLASLALVSVPAAFLVNIIASHKSSPQILSTLLSCLNSELALIPKRIELFASGVPLFLPGWSGVTSNSSPSSPSTLATPSQRLATSVPDPAHIDNCLRVLEIYLIRRVDSDPHARLLVEEQATPLVKGIVTLLVACLCILQAQDENGDDSDDEETAIRSQASNCLETSLRVLVNLTNRSCQEENIDWCKLLDEQEHTMGIVMRIAYFSYASRCGGSLSSLFFTDKGKGRESPIYVSRLRPAELIKKEEDINDNPEMEDTQSDDRDETDAKTFDRLCLALALLTNLMQRDDSSKKKVLTTSLNPACRGRRTCVFTCRCSKQIPALDCLAQIYQHWTSHGTRTDLADAEDSFLRGHVAVLLGMLILLNSSNKKSVLRGISGNDEGEKFNTLISTILDFAKFYANITSKAARALGVGELGNLPQGRTDQIRRAGTAALDDENEMMDKGELRAEGGVEIASQVARALCVLRDQVPP